AWTNITRTFGVARRSNVGAIGASSSRRVRGSNRRTAGGTTTAVSTCVDPATIRASLFPAPRLLAPSPVWTWPGGGGDSADDDRRGRLEPAGLGRRHWSGLGARVGCTPGESLMMSGRCAWHPHYYGHRLGNGVVSWRGWDVRFTAGICTRCVPKFRIEHREMLERRLREPVTIEPQSAA